MSTSTRSDRRNAAGSGYGWGTWKTAFTQGPGRLAATAGTLAALGVVMIGFVVTTCAVNLATSVVLATVEGQRIAWPDFGGTVRALGAAALLDWLRPVTDVLPGTAAGSIAAAIGANPGSEPGGTPGVVTTLSGGPATMVALGYVVFLTAVTAAVVRRRDVP